MDVALLAALVLVAVSCVDSTRPGPSVALAGEWTFQMGVAVSTDSVCHLRGASQFNTAGGTVSGVLTSYEGSCGVTASGTITAVTLRTRDLSFAAGSCSYSATILGDPADSLAGQATCGAVNAAWSAARLGPATSLILAPGDSALMIGDRLSYAIALHDAHGRPIFGRTPHWTSTAPATAEVSWDGLVTARAAGMATITAAAEGRQASATIEVVSGHYAAIGAGQVWTCALTPAGAAYCWGGFSITRPLPTAVPGSVPFASLTVAYNHACGLTSAGAAHCWEEDGAAAPVAPGMTFLSLTAGHGYTCGLAAGGEAWCWGYNFWGQLGSGNTDGSLVPVRVTGGHHFTALAAKGNHTCGVELSGTIYCWGGNWHGELGNGSEDMLPHPVPEPVPGGRKFTAVATAHFATCGLTAEGEVFCWGGCVGEIGNGIDLGSLVAVQVAGGLTYRAITGGENHFCALSDGAAWCWGSNADGQLGDGLTNTVRKVPGKVLGGLSFRELTGGGFHSCGITSRGVAYCWGWNLQHQLGDGTQEERDVPTPVGGQSP